MGRKKIVTLFIILMSVIGLCTAIYYYTNQYFIITPYNIVPVIKNTPNNGVYTTYYGNGDIKTEVHYHMGMKDGKEIIYYKGKVRKQINHYRQGIKNGFSYDYTEKGSLYSVTLYIGGGAQKSHILNDSVYKHEVTIGSYGQNLFEVSCAQCHKKELTSISQIPDSLSVIDTLSAQPIFNIDTVHYYLLDSTLYEHYLRRDTTITLEQYDIKALKFFLEKELLKQKKVKVIRSLNPRSKPL